MKQLDYLHRQLARLGQLRQWYRRATAASAISNALLLALAAFFALDWIFQRSDDRWQRAFLLAVGAGGIYWAIRRFALPWLGKREDNLDLALLVQSRAGIDSDLVAAMQFESSQADGWGSWQLQTAVIDRMSSQQKSLDVMSLLPREPLARRLKVLSALVVMWIVIGLLLPGHVSALFNRLFLGKQHYPTQTQILALTVNGKKIDLSSTEKLSLHVPYGRAVMFEVQATPIASAGGRIELSGLSAGTGKMAEIALEALPSEQGATAAALKGQHPRLIQSAHCEVFVGDAFTDPIALEITPVPVLDIEPEVVPPAYAREAGAEAQKYGRGTSQFSVIEGSKVGLTIHSDRPLHSATLWIKDGNFKLHAVESGEPGLVWATGVSGTPLDSVTENQRFSIQATDTNDDSLDRPVEGLIRIEPDLPPRVVAENQARAADKKSRSAENKPRLVLADASPVIHFVATDDHALGRIWLSCEVVRANSTSPEVEPAKEIELYKLADKEPPTSSQQGEKALDLAGLRLSLGDTLKVTVHALDYRGEREGKLASAEPLFFQVTDELGILSSVLEGDQKSVKRIDDVNKHIRGIGETP